MKQNRTKPATQRNPEFGGRFPPWVPLGFIHPLGVHCSVPPAPVFVGGANPGPNSNEHTSGILHFLRKRAYF